MSLQRQHQHALKGVLKSRLVTSAGCRQARQGAYPAARVLELAMRLVERLKRCPRVWPRVLVLRMLGRGLAQGLKRRMKSYYLLPEGTA